MMGRRLMQADPGFFNVCSGVRTADLHCSRNVRSTLGSANSTPKSALSRPNPALRARLNCMGWAIVIQSAEFLETGRQRP